jgi:Protein kinase domain/TIR domain
MEPGDVIAGRFRVDSLIQHGGMGDVYKGSDQETGAVVAIKVLNQMMLAGDETLVRRFYREADVLRKLDHPNIVRILAMDSQGDQHAIIMEYMGGGSLAELIERGALPTERTMKIALDMADALARAHHLSIIHRDIKPANILLADDGTPRLTDFGVAQVGDHNTRLTQKGALLGTIAYLAPELCTGESYTEQTDIWAFGVVLYQMVVGRHPFEGKTPAAMVGSILNDNVAEIGRFRGDVPAPLEALILHMLHKDPNERLPSARAVGAELERIQHALHNNNNAPAPKAEPQPVAAPVPIIAPVASPPPVTARDAAPVADAERIFISYRREETSAFVTQLADALREKFGRENIIMDIDRLALKTVSRLVFAADVLAGCKTVLVVIGREWVSAHKDALANPKDQVRVEIETALKRPDLHVIPILVDDAQMPKAADLPLSLQGIGTKPPMRMESGADFKNGLRRLYMTMEGSAPPRTLQWRWVVLGVALVIVVLLIAIVVSGAQA